METRRANQDASLLSVSSPYHPRRFLDFWPIGSDQRRSKKTIQRRRVIFFFFFFVRSWSDTFFAPSAPPPLSLLSLLSPLLVQRAIAILIYRQAWSQSRGLKEKSNRFCRLQHLIRIDNGGVGRMLVKRVWAKQSPMFRHHMNHHNFNRTKQWIWVRIWIFNAEIEIYWLPCKEAGRWKLQRSVTRLAMYIVFYCSCYAPWKLYEHTFFGFFLEYYLHFAWLLVNISENPNRLMREITKKLNGDVYHCNGLKSLNRFKMIVLFISSEISVKNSLVNVWEHYVIF